MLNRQAIRQAFSDMLASERQQLEEFFQLKAGLFEEYFAHDEEMFRTMDNIVWRTKSRRVPKEIRYLIEKFRLAANHYLRDVPKPKPYVVDHLQRSLGEQQAWYRNHSGSGIPCPPIKGRTDVRTLAVFVDGCFWHGCPHCLRMPAQNREYWLNKIAGNVSRAKSVSRALRRQGSVVLRVWEHELRSSQQLDRVISKIIRATRRRSVDG